MQIYKVAWKNLLRKKVRTLLTVIGLALSTWVLLSLFGFNEGFRKSLNHDIDNMGYQVLLTAKGCPYEAATLMLKGGTGLKYFTDDMIDSLKVHDEISSVTPMLMQVVFDPNKGESGGINGYLGIDPLSFPKMKPYLKMHKGEWFKSNLAMEAVIGYESAELEQRDVGDMIFIPEKNVTVKVVGILERSGTQDDGTIFLPLGTVQKIFSMENKLTAIGIKVKNDDSITNLEEKLYKLPDVQVVSMSQVKETISNLISTARVMVTAIAIIAILIAMVGVINTVLMSVLERYQEIGILKSMGAMASDIFKLIWTETIIVSLAGGVLGTIMALITSDLVDYLIRLILPYTPNGNLISLNILLVLKSVLIISAIGVISGIYPAYKASKIRPLEAIRMEDNS